MIVSSIKFHDAKLSFFLKLKGNFENLLLFERYIKMIRKSCNQKADVTRGEVFNKSVGQSIFIWSFIKLLSQWVS